MIIMNTNLREIRKLKKVNQEQLAKEIGTCRKTISLIERSKLNPSILLALQIAKYFHSSVEEIFWIEEKWESLLIKQAFVYPTTFPNILNSELLSIIMGL